MFLNVSFRSVALAASIACAALHSPSPACAMLRPQRMDDPGTQVPEYVGDGNHLPVNCHVTPQELLAHARTLQAVRQAAAEFERRGYRARPDLDAAANGCPEPRSFAGLAYERPVTWLDSTHVAQPAILVVTLVNATNGEPLTTVTAGLAILDLERGLVFSGDSLDALEPSFDLVPRGGGGGRGVMPEGFGEEHPGSLFDAYLRHEALRQCLSEPATRRCPDPALFERGILPCFEWVLALTRCIAAPSAPKPQICPEGGVCLAAIPWRVP